MIAGKEELKYIESLAGLQYRIYPDAADFGLILASTEAKLKLRYAIQGLREIYKSDLNKNKDGTWSSTNIFIPFEQEGSIAYRGVYLTVTYNNDTVRKTEFVSIDLIAGRCLNNPYKEM